jgi:sigma-B regulation protein RsbU (phosphoserine phosphatase)
VPVVFAAPALKLQVPATPATFTCGEVRGGNGDTFGPVAVPGVRGLLHSSASGATRGGDVHYVSVCGSGLVSRVALADVAGHGETVAVVGAEMYAHLQRSVDLLDERRVLRDLDARLAALEGRAITTAAMFTYYAPGRRLTWAYAGHPPGWILRRDGAGWRPLETEDPRPGAGFVGLPLGTGFGSRYVRGRTRVAEGDRVLLVTDGVLEAPSPDGEEFGRPGVERLLAAHATADTAVVADALLAALRAHVGRQQFVHDDVSFFVGEFVEGPRGPALWHVLRNRLLPALLGA